MPDFSMAVKAFITNKEGKLLLIRRNDNEAHSAGAWEIPGGRIGAGENPFEGLKREVREEVGIEVDVLNPLSVKHFTRDDCQKITMIVFLCRALTEDIALGTEHNCYEWSGIEEAERKIHQAFLEDIGVYKQIKRIS